MTPRFLHLVAPYAIGARHAYALHLIDPSRFFHPTTSSHGSTYDVKEIEEFQLPPAALTFHGPSQLGDLGAMEFMPLGEGRKKRIVAADHKCRTILCDMAYNAVSTLPALHAPKISPVSVPVGDSLYVLKTKPALGEEHCFEALIHGRGPESRCRPDWYWHSLPPPPYVLAPSHEVSDIYGHALVGGVHIWVSTGHAATYSFSTVASKWSKVGNWDLPFGGRAEYIPELDVSLGFSLQDNLLCASDLAGASEPKLLGKWEDVVQPEQWIPLTSYLVPLGSGKVFIAKFFHIRERRYFQGGYIDETGECFAVFTGVELEYSGGQLSMRKHKSMRYTPISDMEHWVI